MRTNVVAALTVASVLYLGISAYSSHENIPETVEVVSEASENLTEASEGASEAEVKVSKASEEVSEGAEDVSATIINSKQVVSPTEENVRFVSRTSEVDGARWLAQSGSAIEFNVEASSVEIKLVGGEATENEKNMRPRFAVLLDGEVVLDDTLGEYSRTIEVFSGDAERSAVVEVMQLSEAKRGVVGVEAILVESKSSTPVTPTPKKDMSIEFIGDSITCAYGVESTGYDDPFVTTKENFMKSYAYLTAQALDADYSTVCYSAFGVLSGWTDDGTIKEEKLVPPLYEQVSLDFPEPWDSSAHPFDVVVISLGTNDFTYTGADEERMDEFALAYIGLLRQVREQHPESYIICTLGTMGCTELGPYVKRAVQSFRSATGDARVRCYRSDRIDEESDGIGTYGHPNAITHQKISEQLLRAIHKALDEEETS